MPMRMLDFDNRDVERILRETHELAAWVVNQDELLDRRLLEQKQVKVIRYIQMRHTGPQPDYFLEGARHIAGEHTQGTAGGHLAVGDHP